ncbi:hypothetical protein F4808DRAFT_450287 [Astrocystis sublimbata]|nr:hypothetical protein F4808DRAFT_450287 [Astrocystis sublimbata]
MRNPVAKFIDWQARHLQPREFYTHPFEFLAFVPVRAARRGHWPVFYSGTIVMIVFWLITPLQSSILGVGPIHLVRQHLISTPKSLIPIRDQASLLDIGILNDAFAITWLGLDFPSSMTADYALLPFEARDTVPSFATDVYFRSWTWQLSTDLNCWPGNVNGLGDVFRVNNGRGCEVDIVFFGHTDVPKDTQYAMLYVGYYRNHYLDYYLEGPSCRNNSSHQFLAISAARNGTADSLAPPFPSRNYTDITAIFCEPQYSKCNVSVMLSKETLKPLTSSILPKGNNMTLLDSEFNITAFEYLLGTGCPPVDQVRDYPKQITLEQYDQLLDKGIEWPITVATGFAIGSRNYSGTDLHDPATLAAAYSAAHRILFSATVAQLLSNGTDASAVSQLGERHYTTYGVIALLLVVAALAGCLLYHCVRSRNLLTSDPSSICDILGTLNCSEAVSADFAVHDRADAATLSQHVGSNSYFLREKSETGRTILSLDISETAISSIYEKKNESLPSGGGYKPIRPSALSSVSGACFIGVLLPAIVILAYLKQQERYLGGLTPPSSNFEVMQLLENYIPTILATLIEPFWVLINRIYCVFQPFSELQKGRSSPRHSVLAKYTSVPPQLAVWRSARAGQYLLTCICLATLLANVLAISLSGLFNEMPRIVTYPTMVKPARTAIASRNVLLGNSRSPIDYSDHFEWTDRANYYLPFGRPTDRSFSAGDQFKASTIGFGLETICSPIQLNKFSGRFAVTLSPWNTTKTLTLSAKSPNGSYVECWEQYPNNDVNHRLSPKEPSSQEVMFSPRGIRGGVCWSGAPLIIGWMRGREPEFEILRSTFLSCHSSFRVAMFDVTVDADNNIIDSQNLGDPDTNVARISAKNSQLIVDGAAQNIGSFSNGGWHNETVTMDWINHLLTLKIGNRSLVDPTQDVPDPTKIGPILEDLYQQLAATIMGLNSDFFQGADDTTDPIPASVLRTETRIFFSETAYILSIAILSLYVLLFGFVYARGRAILLPRMPTSLGSLLSYSVASQAVEDFAERRELGDQALSTRTYTFGRYIGTDGKPHVGIERAPFVVKLDKRSFRR